MLVLVRLLTATLLCLFCGMSFAQGESQSTSQTSSMSQSAQVPQQISSIPGIISSGSPSQQARSAQESKSGNPSEKAGETDSGLPPPTLEESDFQKFIIGSTGKILPMYGYSMFNGVPSTFAPVEHVPVTPDYVVGPGDEVVIRAWGQVDIDMRATIDRLGQLYIPKVGSLNVAGLKYQDLQGYIKTAIGRNFRNFDLEVNLGQLRSIRIYVVGQAKRSGSYTVSSLSTLVNALFASGGPSEKGSMRHIQLKRNNEVVTEFDVYDFLLKGDKSKDMHLQAGDVIYIPPIGQVVGIMGSVNNPAIYELKDKTDLADLVRMAGGLTNTASGQKVEVERIKNRKDRVVEDFDLDQNGLKKQLNDGDLVRVFSISQKFENAVTLRGNVASPFRYPWHKGMRVTDLVPSKDVLITPDYWATQNKADQVRVSGVTGVFKDIKHSILEINWDYAVIERLNWNDLSTSFIPFNLGKAVLDKDPSQNIELEPGDIVTVFSKNDMQVPMEKQTRLVRIEGEVANAGLYKAKPGETLRQLVERIGGLTPDAYLFGAEFTRESTRRLQQQRLDESINRMEQDISKNATAASQGAMDAKSLETIKMAMQSQKAALERMRTLKAAGRIVLEIPPGASSVKDIPDIALEDGDRLYIPSIPSTVGVFGEVYNENNAFFYKDNKELSDYLAQAGGPTRDADAGRMFLLRADGSVISRQNDRGVFTSKFESMNLMPGDALVVPAKLDRTPLIKSAVDWAQVFMNMGVGIASLRAIGLI